MKSFGELFIHYRMRAEFESLTKLAEAFAEKGYFYELSTFCRWQRGKRIPTKRSIIFTLVTIFVERDAITTTQEANEFLESAGHGYFTQRELEKLFNQTRNPNSQIVTF